MSESLVQVIDPPSFGPANPVYGNITTVPIGDVNFITIAGQVAYTPTGEVPSSLEEQMDLCLSKVQTCLETVGGTVHDMTRFVSYFAEDAYDPDSTIDLIMEKFVPFLKGHRPAMCLCVLKSLSKPELKCEFEAQAVIKRK